ncbi:MAG: hypothetical protein OXG72_13035 [Acidobacteria bacterium]|nr:hypothetical protein [Acidobacteriota bacterium]
MIDQKRLGASSRSTVGTVTEIYTYLRMLFSRCGRPFVGWSHRFSFNHPDGMCPACKGLGKRITVDVDKLLDLDRSIEEGAIRHPAYDIGKWYWREIVQTGVVPPRKPLRRFTAAERQRLLWADDVRIEKVHQGATYERTFEGSPASSSGCTSTRTRTGSRAPARKRIGGCSPSGRAPIAAASGSTRRHGRWSLPAAGPSAGWSSAS